MNRITLIIGGVIVLLLFGAGFWTGYSTKQCPVTTTDTVKVVDPYWHRYADSLAGLPPKEVWKWHPRDTIKLPGDTVKIPVDSTTMKAMLKDYLATYEFGHEFVTDSLDANVVVRVNKNHPIWYGLDYKFKVPFKTVINNTDNSVTYNSYLYAGLSMPIKKEEFNKFTLDATYAFNKGYIKGSFQPLTGTFEAGAGVTIFKFKQKK